MTSPPLGIARVLELDVFRGLAAALMIFNHVAVRLFESGNDETTTTVASFIGSFAPALFFLAAGFGVGLQSGQIRLGHLATRLALLGMADQFLFPAGSSIVGLDFFGFIALSIALVTVIRAIPRAEIVAVLAAGALLLLRYGLAPVIDHPADAPYALVWLLGVHSLTNISYPASPWLAYPLLGFVAARLSRSNPSIARTSVAVGAATCALAALWLNARGAVFFRWGTVSAAYFALSVPVLTISWLIAIALARNVPIVAHAIALGGVSAFTFVPVHYLMIEAAMLLPEIPQSSMAYIVVVLAVLAITLWLSRRFAAFASTLADRHTVGAALVACSVVAACAVGVPGTERVQAVTAQLAICVLLAVSMRARPVPAR